MTSHLFDWKDENFVSLNLPTSYALTPDNHWKSTIAAEGERHLRVYRAPNGRSGLEVQRNYENALTAAGGTRLLGCSGDPCRMQIGDLKGDYAQLLSDPAWSSQRFNDAFHIINGGSKVDHALYRVVRAGRTSYVTVLTVEGAREGVGTVIDVVTEKAMDVGKVSVASADAISLGLKSEGRMAVYGVNFDTGKSDIKADSQAQLKEMANVLRREATLKVFIVGHTDNVGLLEANLVLSQRRAEAIVAALTRDFGIAANRLLARGVANLAPVASNANEDGRARNRRVELVVQ